MREPNDFRPKLNASLADLPLEAKQFFDRSEEIAHRGGEVGDLTEMGMNDTIKAAREAIRTTSLIVCTDDPNYAEARESLEETIEPALDLIVGAIALLTLETKEARALALGAFKLFYKVGKRVFCNATESLRT